MRDGLIILGVFLWLEKALDGDTVSLLEQVEVCGVLVAEALLNLLTLASLTIKPVTSKEFTDFIIVIF